MLHSPNRLTECPERPPIGRRVAQQLTKIHHSPKVHTMLHADWLMSANSQELQNS